VFDLSPEKLLILGVLAMIVLGPEKLPRYARKAGQLLVEVRKVTGSFQEEIRGAIAEPRQALTDAVDEMGLPSLPSIPRVPSVRGFITDTITGAATVETTSRGPLSGPGASAASGASVDRGGMPPAPDDPTLN
jgi:Sec-independent protein translocase protein TatA